MKTKRCWKASSFYSTQLFYALLLLLLLLLLFKCMIRKLNFIICHGLLNGLNWFWLLRFRLWFCIFFHNSRVLYDRVPCSPQRGRPCGQAITCWVATIMKMVEISGQTMTTPIELLSLAFMYSFLIVQKYRVYLLFFPIC